MLARQISFAARRCAAFSTSQVRKGRAMDPAKEGHDTAFYNETTASEYRPISVDVINTQSDITDANVLMFESYSQLGFRLNNGFKVIGPLVMFAHSTIGWNVTEDLPIEALTLFHLLDPKPDILVLGLGTHENATAVGSKFVKFLRGHNISVEALETSAACATYNFLISEGRNVVGAFIPPSFLESSYTENLDAVDNSLVEEMPTLDDMWEDAPDKWLMPNAEAHRGKPMGERFQIAAERYSKAKRARDGYSHVEELKAAKAAREAQESADTVEKNITQSDDKKKGDA